MLPSHEKSVPIMVRPSRVRTVTRSGGGLEGVGEEVGRWMRGCEGLWVIMEGGWVVLMGTERYRKWLRERQGA